MKKILMCLLTVLFVCNAYATTDIAADATTGDCDESTLGTYSGSADLEIKWEPNTIPIRWYDGDNRLTVQSSAQSCTYDEGLHLPTTQPTKNGYVFNGWTVKYIIPAEYVQLEYMESTGYQCIDTEVQLSSNDVTFEWSARDNDTQYGTIFGAELYDIYPDAPDTRQIVSLWGNNSRRLGYLGVTKWLSLPYVSNDNNFHSWSFVIKSNHTAYLVKDGNALPQLAWERDLVTTSSIGLYCNKIDGILSQLTTNVAYKYFRIIDNGQIIFNGVPVRRISDDKLGIWDTVSKTFKTNYYTLNEDFIAGPILQ